MKGCSVEPFTGYNTTEKVTRLDDDAMGVYKFVRRYLPGPQAGSFSGQ